MAAALGALLIAGAAIGEEIRSEARVVVELFTSQGCASCPPADALLTELDGRDDVVALAYHVDYWDYIGWEDTFGSPAFSERQRAYAAGWGNSRIYTPQMVINGGSHVVGSKAREVRSAISSAALGVPVVLTRVEDRIEIRIPPQPGVGDAMIWLVSFIDNAEVTIERGENAGQQILYSQVVTQRQGVGLWDAEAGAVIRMPLSEALPAGTTGVAVLLQPERDGVPGPIMGAALYRR
jgi:hypothetical protein